MQRAKTVYDFLINVGIQANRLTYKGFGQSQPKANNDTEQGRMLNRRTEFLITGK
jgi:outer membrane protein OmpA-like peptidoglycan-associated protein